MQHKLSDPDLLFRTAAAQFAEHGYEGTSLRAIAEKCSVTTMAIYYHFGSKDELYAEVCRQKFDDITYIMAQRVRKVRTIEDRLEVFVNTLFDEWYRDNTLLLLTQREVLNASINPGQCVAQPHYEKLMGMAQTLLSRYVDGELDEDFTFAFGSLIFGYCSMMSCDRKHSTKDLSEYLDHRKKILLISCRQMWRSMGGSG